MGNIPVLKPREVVALLEMLGFTEIRQRGSHKLFVILTVDAQQYRSMQEVIFRQFYFVKSLKILV